MYALTHPFTLSVAFSPFWMFHASFIHHLSYFCLENFLQSFYNIGLMVTNS